MKTRIAILVLTATLVGATAHAAAFKVIVNNGVGVSSLSKKAASDLFMKKTLKWQNGASVVPVDQVAEVREDFSKSIHGKSAAAVKSYWNQLVFSGRDVPPIEKTSDAEVIEFVRSTRGAIGYVSSTAAPDGVRVIEIE
jgi:hypothetical protein